MNKTKFLLISIILIISVFLLYKVYFNLDYRIKISSFLAYSDLEFVDSNNLKKIIIRLKNEDETHYKKLFENYYAEGLGVENQEFLTYYSEKNKWRKTSLTINNHPYKVKIKAHGRTPYAHKFGDDFSLSIKFSGNQYPLYSKRVNLIIYNRIQLRCESIKLLANKFNLPYADFELVYVQIGDNKGSLYFVEERINKDFFKHRNLPWIVFNKGFNGSIIYHGESTLQNLTKQLNFELEKRNDVSSSMKLRIRQDYLTFNNAIQKGDVKTLKAHLDLDYCARINAFRIINGDDGHGFSSDNFEMAYDTINHIFYPIIHRDNFGTVLSNCSDPYTFMDNTRSIIPFFILLDSDSLFIKLTDQSIAVFLNNNSEKNIEIEIDSIINYYNNSHIFKFSTSNSQTNGKWIIENIHCLTKAK